MDNNILLTLSEIFKEGYTIQINNDNIKQYSDINKSYIVSYRTLITIRNDKPIFSKHCTIPKHCIIGYWFNKQTNMGYIELNKAFKHMHQGLMFAYQHKQEYIYSLNNQKHIRVKDWNTKIKKWLNNV